LYGSTGVRNQVAASVVPAPRILIVDDNAPLRYAVGRTLRQHGFEVLEAATGEEALTAAASEQPDLILLDVNLPDIHGFEVARGLKHDERTRSIPILQISASFVQLEHRMAGLAAGADAYLVEPVEPGELVANIRALLRMRDAEAGLQRTTAMLAAVIEASPLAITVLDRDRVIRRWNPAAERLFGYSAADLVGQDLSAVADEQFQAAFPVDEGLLDRVARNESVSALERRARRRDGTWIDVSIFAAPLPGSPSQGYVAILEDISDRKRYERERSGLLAREREARREAEAANRLKDEFLATLSHELRTPLNAVMGWVRMLQTDALDADGRARALAVIERNAQSQEQLIGDILEVSRIIRGQLRLDMKPVDLVEVVHAAVDSVNPTVVAKRLELTVQLPSGPVVISGDRERLQQILWNLLSNAAKYTPRDGRIVVTISSDPQEVAVAVRDSGVGIAPGVIPHIFERFRQGDSGTTREFGGLGLGLAIVRHLTEAHGGTVHAHSDGLGRGAAFTVTFPLAAPHDAAASTGADA
jgi:PAS domain S-box-containing protein